MTPGGVNPEWVSWLSELGPHLANLDVRLSRLETGTSIERAAYEGRAFRASTGQLTLGAATPVLDATLENLSTSGELMVVHELVVVSTLIGFGTFMIQIPGVPFTNPITGSSRPVVNSRVGGPAAKQIMRSRTATVANALGGGIASGMALGVPANTRQSIHLPAPIIVPPGVTLGLTFPFAGAGSGSLTVLWLCEPI